MSRDDDRNIPDGADDGDDELIYLVDDEGTEYAFELLHVLPVDGKDYAVLMPADEEEEESEEEGTSLVIMRIEQDESEEEVLVDLDSDEEFERVSRAWERWLEEGDGDEDDDGDEGDEDDDEGEDEDEDRQN